MSTDKITQRDINNIVWETCDTFRGVIDPAQYSYVITPEELEENKYNLNIPRYVDTFEEEAEIDIEAAQKKIDSLEKELAEVQQEMDGYLKELGY